MTYIRVLPAEIKSLTAEISADEPKSPIPSDSTVRGASGRSGSGYERLPQITSGSAQQPQHFPRAIQRYANLKRSPLKRDPNHRIPKISPRKARANRLLAKTKRQALIESDGQCELRVPGVCTGIAVDPHHLKHQSQGGTHERANVKVGCRACHEWCHKNHAEAVRMGLVIETRGAA
jgi:hypothetical protein